MPWWMVDYQVLLHFPTHLVTSLNMPSSMAVYVWQLLCTGRAGCSPDSSWRAGGAHQAAMTARSRKEAASGTRIAACSGRVDTARASIW